MSSDEAELGWNPTHDVEDVGTRAGNSRDLNHDGQQWAWWSGSDDEFYTNGPFSTKEEAVAELDGHGGYVVEAVRGRVEFSATRLIDQQYFDDDDYFSGEHGEPDRVGDGELIAQADAELQAALDAWLVKWRRTFVVPEMFANSRNHESIPVDYTSDGELSEVEEAELVELEKIPGHEIMHYQRERRHYLRERKAFFESDPC